MQRITRPTLWHVEDLLNKALQRLGSSRRFQAGHRYGYWAIDQCYADVAEPELPGSIRRTFTAGLTMRQAHDTFAAMLEALDCVEYYREG